MGALLALSAIGSCGPSDGWFQLEGKLEGINQGEFYIYSPEGMMRQRDTIRVANGRFTYSTPLDTRSTLMLVFPNYSEVPVFAEPGKEVNVEGEASHLREIKVSGTDDNDLMTAFRLKAAEQTPPEQSTAVADFVKRNHKSQASVFLINQYFIKTPTPDYKQASALVDAMMASDPENGRLIELKKALDQLKNICVGSTLPSFSATDIRGQRVSNATLNGRANVVVTWASWNYDSQNILKKLTKLRTTYGSRLQVVGICLDGKRSDCDDYLRRDSLAWSTVCDEKMWDTPLLARLGLLAIPDNLVTDAQGRIVAHGLTADDLSQKLESMLK